MPMPEHQDPMYSALASGEAENVLGETSESSPEQESDCESHTTIGMGGVDSEQEAFLRAQSDVDDPGAPASRNKRNWPRYAFFGSFFCFGGVIAVGQVLWQNWTVETDSNEMENYDTSPKVHYNWNGKKCFESNQELTEAVDAYLLNKSDETISQVYGLPIGIWCTKYVQDFSYVFGVDRNELVSEQMKVFNDDISNWDTSSVVSLDRTFRGCEEFDQDLKWDTSKVVTMRGTFAFTKRFDGDIRAWDVSKVTNFEAMFYEAQRFDRNLAYWDVSSARNMISFFRNAPRFNQDLCVWGQKITAATDVTGMFMSSGCPPESNVGPFFDATNGRPGPFCHPCE